MENINAEINTHAVVIAAADAIIAARDVNNDDIIAVGNAIAAIIAAYEASSNELIDIFAAVDAAAPDPVAVAVIANDRAPHLVQLGQAHQNVLRDALQHAIVIAPRDARVGAYIAALDDALQDAEVVIPAGDFNAAVAETVASIVDGAGNPPDVPVAVAEPEPQVIVEDANVDAPVAFAAAANAFAQAANALIDAANALTQAANALTAAAGAVAAGAPRIVPAGAVAANVHVGAPGGEVIDAQLEEIVEEEMEEESDEEQVAPVHAEPNFEDYAMDQLEEELYFAEFSGRAQEAQRIAAIIDDRQAIVVQPHALSPIVEADSEADDADVEEDIVEEVEEQVADVGANSDDDGDADVQPEEGEEEGDAEAGDVEEEAPPDVQPWHNIDLSAHSNGLHYHCPTNFPNCSHRRFNLAEKVRFRQHIKRCFYGYPH